VTRIQVGAYIGGLALSLSLVGCASHRHPHMDGSESALAKPRSDSVVALPANPPTRTQSGTQQATINRESEPRSSESPSATVVTAGGGQKSALNQQSGNTEDNSANASGGAAGKATVSTMGGNSAQDNGAAVNSTLSVDLAVTTDFGQKLIQDKQLALQSDVSVMDLLNRVCRVDSAYGGNFVNGINGIKSGYTDKAGNQQQKADWFYWVNGALAADGAADYIPKRGDAVWWDYHSWDGSIGIPAVIGAFPHPFTTGYNGATPGTTVLYSTGEQAVAGRLAAALKRDGANAVYATVYTRASLVNASTNVIVVAPWSAIASDPTVEGLAAHPLQTGWFAQFSNKSVTVRASDGTLGTTYSGHAGVLLATCSGSGVRSPVWFVTGLTASDVDATTNVLIAKPTAIAHEVGAFVVNDRIISVPVR